MDLMAVDINLPSPWAFEVPSYLEGGIRFFGRSEVQCVCSVVQLDRIQLLSRWSSIILKFLLIVLL